MKKVSMGRDTRSTTRSEFNMALSTISGPQTSFAPCLRAKSLVGTEDTEMRNGKEEEMRRTGTRTNHWRKHDAISVIIRSEAFQPRAFGVAGRRK
jgi:hypothetical protein